jgi:hypothetical protein
MVMRGEERLAVGVMMGITMTADGDLYSFAIYFALISLAEQPRSSGMLSFYTLPFATIPDEPGVMSVPFSSGIRSGGYIRSALK